MLQQKTALTADDGRWIDGRRGEGDDGNVTEVVTTAATEKMTTSDDISRRGEGE